MHLPLGCLVFFFILQNSYCEELPVKYVSLRTVDSLGRTIPRLSQQNLRNYNGPIILKRDIPNNVILIQSDFKQMPSIKTARLDEFYSTKEFNDLLKEFKLNIDKNKLPDIKDVASFLGTTNSEDTYKEIRDFASTEDGLDIIKSYFQQNSASDRMDDIFNIFNTQPKASMFHSDSDYRANGENNENSSWWDKLIKWFGLSQSTKIDSAKNDVEIFSSIVPLSNSVPKNVKYIGSLFKPPPNTEIPINPPFKVFNSHSINLSNQPYSVDVKTLPTIRMTEHQYNEMMKSVNLNSQKLAKNEAMRRVGDSSNKEFIEDQFKPSDIKRSFSIQSDPIRHTSYDLPTGSHYKANPDYIDKISKILSEKYDDKHVVSAVSDLTVQQHSRL
ncbi:unnamed protein product [Chironomus riparius]|uniref:Uncharacterized protein n=1 Tax=Chironomus riparius TaxID=315576 RepID=A0A9N9RUZ0_9DIPT|nr:unnamed protein product [Chironomus riparius]